MSRRRAQLRKESRILKTAQERAKKPVARWPKRSAWMQDYVDAKGKMVLGS